jgi:hypothetical protein
MKAMRGILALHLLPRENTPIGWFLKTQTKISFVWPRMEPFNGVLGWTKISEMGGGDGCKKSYTVFNSSQGKTPYCLSWRFHKFAIR